MPTRHARRGNISWKISSWDLDCLNKNDEEEHERKRSQEIEWIRKEKYMRDSSQSCSSSRFQEKWLLHLIHSSHESGIHFSSFPEIYLFIWRRKVLMMIHSLQCILMLLDSLRKRRASSLCYSSRISKRATFTLNIECFGSSLSLWVFNCFTCSSFSSAFAKFSFHSHHREKEREIEINSRQRLLLLL